MIETLLLILAFDGLSDSLPSDSGSQISGRILVTLFKCNNLLRSPGVGVLLSGGGCLFGGRSVLLRSVGRDLLGNLGDFLSLFDLSGHVSSDGCFDLNDLLELSFSLLTLVSICLFSSSLFSNFLLNLFDILFRVESFMDLVPSVRGANGVLLHIKRQHSEFFVGPATFLSCSSLDDNLCAL